MTVGNYNVFWNEIMINYTSSCNYSKVLVCCPLFISKGKENFTTFYLILVTNWRWHQFGFCLFFVFAIVQLSVAEYVVTTLDDSLSLDPNRCHHPLITQLIFIIFILPIPTLKMECVDYLICSAIHLKGVSDLHLSHI